jgi:predicted Ser/Thr protein kinase
VSEGIEKIGKYDVVKELGRGGMGVVYKAHDSLMERDVAIKLISEVVLAVPEIKSRFLREAQTAGKLSHENITVIFDVGEDKGRPFIVMEYLEGNDLGEIIEDGKPLPLADKLDYLVQICRGLSYSHSRGIIHRDIKPGNIRITGRRKVKIMDFGIARAESSNLTRTGAIIGTPYYMSPEQVQGKKIDKRSDIFSFGVLLYELMTGRKPFPGDEPTGVMYKIVFEEPDQIDDKILSQPRELREIVLKLLAKDPEKRYQDLSEAAVDLEKILQQVRTGEWKKKEEEHKRIEKALGEVRDSISAKKFKRAGEILDRLATENPSDEQIAQAQGELHQAEQAEARRVLIAERLVAANKAFAAKKYDRAAEAAREILALDPQHVEALRIQREAGDALLYERTGDGAYARTQVNKPSPAVERPQPVKPTMRPTAKQAKLAPPSAQRKNILLIAAAVALVVVGFVLWKFVFSTSGVPQGYIALNVRPWGEVTHIVQAGGGEVSFPKPAITPCRLALPPGTYTITVSNPALGSQDFTVTVSVGGVQEVNQAFTKFNPEEAVGAFQD